MSFSFKSSVSFLLCCLLPLLLCACHAVTSLIYLGGIAASIRYHCDRTPRDNRTRERKMDNTEKGKQGHENEVIPNKKIKQKREHTKRKRCYTGENVLARRSRYMCDVLVCLRSYLFVQAPFGQQLNIFTAEGRPDTVIEVWARSAP